MIDQGDSLRIPTGSLLGHTRRGGEDTFEILSENDLLLLPDPAWLVEGILVKSSLAVLFGPPGIGKSFTALDLALSVATGRPFLGHAAIRGRSLYVAAEGTAGLKKRVLAWKEQSQVNAVPDFLLLGHAVDCLQDTQVTKLIRSVDAPPALVVVDTLARSMHDGDENSAKDMGAFVHAMERIQRELGATVLVVHHPGKSGGSERGSSALRAAADTMLALGSNKGVLRLTCDKQKDCSPFEPIRLRLVPAGESCVVERGDVQQAGANSGRSLSILVSKGSELGMRRAEWLKACEEQGITESSFERDRRDLLRRKAIMKIGRAYRPVVPTLSGASSQRQFQDP